MDFQNLQEIGTAIQARHIAVPLERALTTTRSERAHVLQDVLEARGFDFAPVLEGRHVVGLIDKSSAAAAVTHVGECLRPLEEDLLVSDATPVAQLFQFMSQEPFLFVVSQRRISGFVTTADLGSSPVRTHFYLLLAASEMAMARLVRREFPDQQRAIELLSERRIAHHVQLIGELRQSDELLDDVAALSFGDLVSICGQNEPLKAWMTANGRSFKTSTKGLALFRNDVMHPVRQFTDGSPQRVSRLADYDRNLCHLVRGVNQQLAPSRSS